MIPKFPSYRLLTIYHFVNSYSFQTPEAWNNKDQYRSICYMRPLAIWAMQWALTRPNLLDAEERQEVKEDSMFVHRCGFSKVACLLKLPEEGKSRSLLQALCEFALTRVGI